MSHEIAGSDAGARHTQRERHRCGRGGILRVDTLAHGVVEAAKKTNVQVPVVLRLEGTNVEQGREILKNSGLNFIIGETMQDAAAKVVAAAKEKASRK